MKDVQDFWYCKRVAKQNESILFAKVEKSGLHDPQCISFGPDSSIN